MFKKFNKIKLNKNEKQVIKNNLISYIKKYPLVRKVEVSRHIYSTQFLKLNLKYMPFILIAVLLLGGAGVSAAAETSLPGDALYPVKINVNERAWGLLHFDNEGKGKWEAELVGKRLEELEKLSFSGELKDKLQEKIETNIDKHTEKINEKIAKLEKNGNIGAAASIASHLQSYIDAHQKLLEDLENLSETLDENGNNSTSSTLRILPFLHLKIDKIKNNIKEKREDLENDVEEKDGSFKQESAEGKLKAFENKFEEVNKFIERIKENLNEDLLTKIEEKLQSATEAMEKGKKYLEEKEYAMAFVSFGNAHRLVQEAKVLAKSGKKFGEFKEKAKERLDNVREKRDEAVKKIEEKREELQKKREEKRDKHDDDKDDDDEDDDNSATSTNS